MKKGFTLLELIIVVTIIGILAAFSLPQYMRARERTLDRTAETNLNLMTSAVRINRVENRNSACTNTQNCNQVLGLSIPSGPDTSWVYSISPADINQDGIVDILDLVIVAKAYGSSPGDANWDPRADLNSDGQVGLIDLAILADVFGQSPAQAQRNNPPAGWARTCGIDGDGNLTSIVGVCSP